MSRKLAVKSALLGCLSLAALFAAGCSSMSSNLTGTASSQTGQAFVIGTDAPAASVVSFNVQVQSIDAVNTATNTSVSLISGSPMVDFARFDGLQDLLNLSDVPVGTYDSIVITLGSTAQIGYLDTSTAEPTIQEMTLPVSPNSTTIALPSALVVNKSQSMGLRVDFKLNKSLADSTGQIASTVTPTFAVSVVKPGDSGGHVDELIGSVVSVDSSNQQFVIQRPNGRQFTILVSGRTDWDGNATFSSLNAGSTIVQISGTVDNAESTIDADEIAILSQDKFFASGQITYTALPSAPGPGSFDLYVRNLEPSNTALSLGALATVNLTGSENYSIYWMRNPMTQFLFNEMALTPGQDVAIGGPTSDVTSATTTNTNRVVLRPWGFTGTIVSGSITQSPGSFQMNVTGFAGVLINTPVTVYMGGETDYEDGMTGFGDLSGGTKVRVVGLLLKDPTNGNLVLLARHIDGGDN